MCYEKTVETAVEEVGEAEYSILFGICDGGFGVFSEHGHGACERVSGGKERGHGG